MFIKRKDQESSSTQWFSKLLQTAIRDTPRAHFQEKMMRFES